MSRPQVPCPACKQQGIREWESPVSPDLNRTVTCDCCDGFGECDEWRAARWLKHPTVPQLARPRAWLGLVA